MGTQTTQAEAEAAWFTCTDPRPMYGLLRGKERGRKFRLYACACCRRVSHLLTDDRSHRALDTFVQFLDGELTMKQYSLGEREAADACAAQASIASSGGSAFGSEADSVRQFACMFAAQAVMDCFGAVTNAPADCCGALRGYNTADITNESQMREAGDRIETDERAAQAALLRDIFGNPFEPITFEPAWRSEDAVKLARQMYHSGDFEAMPDLGDALQSAGCDNERILNHCSYAALTHVRGCWVVDLVLGKM